MFVHHFQADCLGALFVCALCRSSPPSQRLRRLSASGTERLKGKSYLRPQTGSRKGGILISFQPSWKNILLCMKNMKAVGAIHTGDEVNCGVWIREEPSLLCMSLLGLPLSFSCLESKAAIHSNISSCIEQLSHNKTESVDLY